MMKRCKKANAWLLALAILISLLAVPKVYGAGGIDTGRACSLSLAMDGQYPELDNLTVLVKVYRVASVATDGIYTDLEGFEGLDLSAVDSETTAQQWSDLAARAAEIVGAGGMAPTAQTQLQKQPGQEHSTGRIEGLAAGMYLVEAESVESEEYTYNFIPYLAALPGNYYASTGDDTWVYDVDTALKPEQQPRLGSLVIEKALTDYNTSLGDAAFVFQVEGTVGSGQSARVVYSNVVSLVFDGAGEKSLQIDDLPAGAQVTVTEVYSGASYQAVTNPEQTAVITAGGQPERVRFENTYNQSPNSGSSIVNHFRYEDGVWTPEQLTDSSNES